MTAAKKSYLFPMFLCLLVLAQLIAVVCGWQYVWNLLEDYEGSLPERQMEELVADVRAQKYAEIMELCGYEPSEFETAEDFGRYLRDVALAGEGAITFARQPSLGEEKRYALVREGKALADVRLRKRVVKSEYGFDLWEPAAFEVPVEAAPDLTIIVPEGASVSLNAVEAGKEYITETLSAGEYETLPEEMPRPKRERYRFTGLLFEPHIAVIDASGGVCVVEGEGTEREAVRRPMPEQRGEWGKLPLAAAQAYAKYATGDAGYGELAATLLQKSTIYRTFAAFDNSWYIDHDSHSFDQIEVDDFKLYDETHFSCDVSFDYHIFKGNKKFDFPSAYSIYCVWENDRWQIANLLVR